MLSVDRLCVGYGGAGVLHGVSLRVPKGQVVSLLGGRGAGKTTALRAIAGMVSPSAGRISFGGEDVTGVPAFRLSRKGLAYASEGRRACPGLTVHDNLLLGAFARLSGTRPREELDQDMARVLVHFPRLRQRQNELAGTLSGGEQQMLAMARALMLSPAIVLLDEPSMGLAPVLVDEVFHIIAQLRREGVTMLLVEQFAAAALKVSDHAYVLENGRIVLEGPAEQLQNDPAVHAAYLGGAAATADPAP
ncbi:ABC transporter ATP-binding protein [Roseateles sp. BYS180W]|uniref:ABC transporter ATP-binding protein n=1 Tax=Roseateles rivi TaxID=3299028 RepID=A0ABW7FYT2_9BURK